jgi:chromosome segregation ATPase
MRREVDHCYGRRWPSKRKPSPGGLPGHSCFMDKLSRQEQVWLSIFTATMFRAPIHKANEIASDALMLFETRFGDKVSSRDMSFKEAVAAAATIDDQRDAGFRRIQDLERELALSRSNEMAAVKCFREDLTRAHARIDNFEVVKDGLERELNKANGRNFELQKEFNDYKEDAFTARTELAGKLERRDAEIQELRTLLEEMTKAISERDELIAKIRAERDEFEGRLISNMTREALRLDA